MKTHFLISYIVLEFTKQPHLATNLHVGCIFPINFVKY